MSQQPSWVLPVVILAVVLGTTAPTAEANLVDGNRSSAVRARFVGPYEWIRVDRDQDGQAEALRVQGKLRIDGPGTSSWSWGGHLSAQEEAISVAASDRHSSHTRGSIRSVQPGEHPFHLDFGGEAIRRSGRDGQYTAHLVLFGDGVVDRATVISPLYEAGSFGEYTMRIVAISDKGIDLNGNGTFEQLRVSVTVNSTKQQIGGLTALLLSLDGKRFVEKANASGALARGTTTLHIDFDGRVVRDSAIAGPYRVRVEASDGPMNDPNETYETGYYAPTDFEPPKVVLSGELRDEGVSLGGDDRFEVLRVQVGVRVAEKTEAHWWGELYSGSRKLTNTSGHGALTPGTDAITIDFRGYDIGLAGLDGPYEVRDFRLFDKSGKTRLFEEQVGVTRDYKTRDFAYPRVVANDFKLEGVDTDGNGKWNRIDFACAIVSELPGSVSVSAELWSPLRIVDFASKFVRVERGVPASVVIQFPAEKIAERAADGRFQIRVEAYHFDDREVPFEKALSVAEIKVSREMFD